MQAVSVPAPRRLRVGSATGRRAPAAARCPDGVPRGRDVPPRARRHDACALPLQRAWRGRQQARAVRAAAGRRAGHDAASQVCVFVGGLAGGWVGGQAADWQAGSRMPRDIETLRKAREVLWFAFRDPPSSKYTYTLMGKVVRLVHCMSMGVMHMNGATGLKLESRHVWHFQPHTFHLLCRGEGVHLLMVNWVYGLPLPLQRAVM